MSQKGVPQGYEAISLIEALNGPCFYNNKSAEPIPARNLNSGGQSVHYYLLYIYILYQDICTQSFIYLRFVCIYVYI